MALYKLGGAFSPMQLGYYDSGLPLDDFFDQTIMFIESQKIIISYAKQNLP